MSSPSPEPEAAAARLIVVCGVAADSAACADRFVRSAIAEGLSTRLITASGVDPMTLPAQDPWLVQYVTRSGGTAADQDHDAAVLPSARLAAVLAALRSALADVAVDVVVLDAGDERAARDLLAHADSVPRLIERAGDPLVAMRATAGSDVDRLSRARSTALADAHAITGPDAVWRIVLPTASAPVDRSVEVLAALVVLGARVDGIVLEDYPGKHERAADRSAARSTRTDLAERTPLRVVRSGRGRVGLPKGAGVRDHFGPVARMHCGRPDQRDGVWWWPIALPPRLVDRVRPGVHEDRLVLAAGGSYRWIELPPALRRAEASEAVMTADGLRIGFVPDGRRWPTGPASTEAADGR